MEELKNEVVNETTSEEVAVSSEPVEEGGSVCGKLLGLVVIGAVGVGAWAIKNRTKLAERKTRRNVAKLEKAGYVVLPKEDIVEMTEVETSEEGSDEE